MAIEPTTLSSLPSALYSQTNEGIKDDQKSTSTSGQNKTAKTDGTMFEHSTIESTSISARLNLSPFEAIKDRFGALPLLSKINEGLLSEDSSVGLVAKIKQVTTEFLQNAINEIKAARELGDQALEISGLAKETDAYALLDQDKKNDIDGYEQKLMTSQKKLSEADEEGKALLDSPPSIGDLFKKVQNLNKAREDVVVDTQVLLVCLATNKVIPSLEALSSTRQSQSKQNENDATTTLDTTTRPDTASAHSSAEQDKVDEKNKNRAEDKASDLVKTLKTASKDQAKKAAEERHAKEKEFLAAEGIQNAEERKAAAAA